MKHGQISRISAKAFFAFATLALAGACADNTVAPAAEIPAFVAPANFVKLGNSIVFKVDNQQGITKRLGAHLITIPAGAICDMNTSGYGASTWNQECAPHSGVVTITATVMQGPNGEPHIDFQPSLRFSPNRNVMLFFREGRSQAKQLFIQWCDNTGKCFDEAMADAALQPFRVGKSSIIGRRIKHFTGYNIGYGETCPGTIVDNGDGTYFCETGNGFSRRSGYMVASGEDVVDLMDDERGGKKDQ